MFSVTLFALLRAGVPRSRSTIDCMAVVLLSWNGEA
jgi:hypothetical protein